MKSKKAKAGQDAGDGKGGKRSAGREAGTPVRRLEFIFEKHPFTCVTRGEAPWFINGDVCASLGIENPSQAAARLDDDEKAEVCLTYTSSNGTVQRRRTTVISESGLYTLILRSRGATTPGTKAHRFRKWVTGTVIPQIRREGFYRMENGVAPEPHDEWLVRQVAKHFPPQMLLELLPRHQYGSRGKNGRPRLGMQRAAFTELPHRTKTAALLGDELPLLRFAGELSAGKEGSAQCKPITASCAIRAGSAGACKSLKRRTGAAGSAAPAHASFRCITASI